MKSAVAVAVCAVLCVTSGASLAAGEAGAAETRFQFGLSGASGMSDLKDKIQTNNPSLALSTISPVGVSFGGFHDFGSGFAVGGSIGPLVRAGGAISFTIVPISIDVRYRFSAGESMGMYVRAGVEKASVSGDTVKSASTGGVAAVGVNFSRSWGLEAAFHSTPVGVKATAGHRELEAKPYKGVVTVFFQF